MTLVAAPRRGPLTLGRTGPIAGAVVVATILLTLAAPAIALVAMLAILPAMALLARVGQSPLDAASLGIVLIWSIAVIPATLSIGALGSVGTPQTLLGVIALGVAVATWLHPDLGAGRRLAPIPILVVVFVAANLASFVAASTRAADDIESRAADRGLMAILASAGAALLIAYVVEDRQRLDAITKAIVVAGAIIAAVGVIQFTTGYDPAAHISIPGLQSTVDPAFVGERSIFRRVAGTMTHAIEFSAVLCMCLPLACHFAIHRSRRWLIAVGLIAVALPMSVSRTAALGIAVVVATYVPGLPRQLRRRFVLFAGGYLVVVRVLFPGLLGTIRALFLDSGDDPSIKSRRTDYEFVWRFVDARPWFGRGYGTFIPTRYDFLDNQYLLGLVEVGVVGVGAFLLVLIGSAATARLVRERSSDPVDRDLAQALFSAIAVAFVTSVAFDFLSFSGARMFLFVLVGCVGALWTTTQPSPPTDDVHVRQTGAPRRREKATTHR